jgi:type II secretory pathway pseudopilin PulG
MTLIELLVSMTVVAVVLTMAMVVVAGMQKIYERESDRSGTNDQVRLAVEELDREIRSGNVLYDPAAESDPGHDVVPGMSLRIYTQSNANSRPGFRCVQWRITSGGELQNRTWWTSWRDSPDALVADWRIVADHVVNRSNSPQVMAFTLDTSDASYGSRLVKIVFVVNEDAKSGQDLRVTSSVEGRNTTFGYPNNACADIPPY